MHVFDIFLWHFSHVYPCFLIFLCLILLLIISFFLLCVLSFDCNLRIVFRIYQFIFFVFACSCACVSLMCLCLFVCGCLRVCYVYECVCVCVCYVCVCLLPVFVCVYMWMCVSVCNVCVHMCLWQSTDVSLCSVLTDADDITDLSTDSAHYELLSPLGTKHHLQYFMHFLKSHDYIR